LATEFALFDRWYAAGAQDIQIVILRDTNLILVPGPTQPNRLFVHSATSYGASDNDTVDLAEGYPQKTIYDS